MGAGGGSGDRHPMKLQFLYPWEGVVGGKDTCRYGADIVCVWIWGDWVFLTQMPTVTE